MRRGALAILFTCAAAVLAGAGGVACVDDDESSAGTLEVVATTAIVADVVQEVGGDRVDVRRLLQPGADPHDYEPRPSDARAISRADVVYRSGGEIDDWLDDVIDSVGDGDRVEALKDSARPSSGARPDEPHWWLDPRRAEATVGTIRDSLAAADGAGRAEYAARARAYGSRLRRLDQAIRRCIETLPQARRKLVTTHDAFGAFARRYGLEVVGTVIPSRSTQAQPSAGEVADLVKQIRDADVPAIFPERSLSSKLERRIADESGARLGDALWIDTLGSEGSGASTYVEAMASNTAAIVKGLSAEQRSCRPQV